MFTFQLFCLARALLRDAKIVVMDEATASVDIQTEAAIYRVMSEAFRDKTVFTIAVSTVVPAEFKSSLFSSRFLCLNDAEFHQRMFATKCCKNWRFGVSFELCGFRMRPIRDTQLYPSQ